MPDHIVIIGAGMAAGFLLEELRNIDHNLVVTVVGEEANSCYNRVMLSSLLAGEHTEQDLSLMSGRHSNEPNIISGAVVTAVDIDKKTCATNTGLTLEYDAIVFATGASVAVPALPGTELAGVTAFRTLEDTRHLRQIATPEKRAVVVGGGLLGLEAAHGLNSLGCHTTVVHRSTHPMNRQLDGQGGAQLRTTLEAQGIVFQMGTTVKKLHRKSNAVSAVEVNSGVSLPCDIVVFATGIEPRISLAERSGIASQKGILVDPMMATQVPYVYALGECSQLGPLCFGLVAPIRRQASVLARRLCGQSSEHFVSNDYPTQLKISGIDIYSAGNFASGSEDVFLHDESAGIYRRLVIDNDRLVGAVLVGDKRGGAWYSELIENKTNVSAFRRGLMFGRDVCNTMAPAASAAA